MRTQLRTIALVTATVVVVGALLVLFIRVRSEQEIVVSEDALSEARARYERARSGTRERASEPSFQADRSAMASRPSQRPPMEEPAASDLPMRPGGSATRVASDGPQPPPPVPPASSTGQLTVEQVRNAYDHGDFESALDLAERFLSENPQNDYVKRVAVVAACAMGEEAVAQKHYNETVPRDQPVVAKRCRRYGIQF
jgi:hypothetical protein